MHREPVRVARSCRKFAEASGVEGKDSERLAAKRRRRCKRTEDCAGTFFAGAALPAMPRRGTKLVAGYAESSARYRRGDDFRFCVFCAFLRPIHSGSGRFGFRGSSCRFVASPVLAESRQSSGELRRRNTINVAKPANSSVGHTIQPG